MVRNEVAQPGGVRMMRMMRMMWMMWMMWMMMIMMMMMMMMAMKNDEQYDADSISHIVQGYIITV